MKEQENYNLIEQKAQALIDRIECKSADEKFAELRVLATRSKKPAISGARKKRFILSFSASGFAAAASVFLIVLFAVILKSGAVLPDPRTYYTDADLTPSEVEISAVQQTLRVLAIPGIDEARLRELEQYVAGANASRESQRDDLNAEYAELQPPSAGVPGESPPTGDAVSPPGADAPPPPEITLAEVTPLPNLFYLRESVMLRHGSSNDPVCVRFVYGVYGSDNEELEIRIVFADNYTFDGQKNYDHLDHKYAGNARFDCTYRLDDVNDIGVLYARFTFEGAVYYISYAAASPDLGAVLALME